MTEFDETKFIVDDYDHPNPGLFYTVTRIGTEFEYYEKGCVCENSECTTEMGCDCLKYGDNYQLNDEGNLILKSDKFDNVPVFECNFNCSCFENVKNCRGSKEDSNFGVRSCPNRKVQFGPLKTLEIFDAGKKGLGLKTNEKIRRGTFICEYAGEIINLETAKTRQKNQKPDGMNYIFILKEYAGDKLYNVTSVDPTVIGNVGRYINHSCQPNSAIVPIRVNDSTPHLCVFAIRDIEKNEEICYDYSGRDCIEILPKKDFQSRKLCFCETPECKKLLPYELNV